jgi:hypothetical protein
MIPGVRRPRRVHVPAPRRAENTRHAARRAGLIALALGLVALVWLPASTTADPVAGDVVGSYRFTYRVTNAEGFTRWIYQVRRRCAAPCSRFSVTTRLSSRRRPAKRLSVYTWTGSAYARKRTLRHFCPCIGRAKKAVPAGYDIVSREEVRVTRISAGRIVAFRGTGRDDYRPNARGRRGGCRPGAYLFDVTGLALPRQPGPPGRVAGKAQPN